MSYYIGCGAVLCRRKDVGRTVQSRVVVALWQSVGSLSSVSASECFRDSDEINKADMGDD